MHANEMMNCTDLVMRLGQLVYSKANKQKHFNDEEKTRFFNSLIDFSTILMVLKHLKIMKINWLCYSIYPIKVDLICNSHASFLL